MRRRFGRWSQVRWGREQAGAGGHCGGGAKGERGGVGGQMSRVDEVVGMLVWSWGNQHAPGPPRLLHSLVDITTYILFHHPLSINMTCEAHPCSPCLPACSGGGAGAGSGGPGAEERAAHHWHCRRWSAGCRVSAAAKAGQGRAALPTIELVCPVPCAWMFFSALLFSQELHSRHSCVVS